MNIVKELDYILEFTKVYQSESDRHLREAKCLKLQTTAILAPLVEDDLIAGRMQHHWVGFSPQYGGLYTYFFHNNKVEEALRTAQDTLAPEYIQQVRKAYDFWQQEKTVKRLQDRYLESYDCLIPVENTHNPGIGNADCRLAGTTVDLDKLIRLGLPGLRAEISKFSAKSQNNSFYQALDMTIDTIADACAAYEKQAREFYQKTGAIHFEKMANALCNIQTNCPKTFQEGLQLMWVYAMISDLMNYGRMDVYLGDLYVHDRNNNLITEEEAIGLITSVYRHMLRVNKIHDSRVIIGGRGRRNEKNADELALIIMEVSRRFKQVVPQLTMRYYHGMDERLFDKALKVNAEGTTFPIIYSDDTNIPAVQKVYGVTKEEAQQYVPFGCGEYVLEGLSLGTPNNGINLLKALEVTLHRGMDMYWNIRVGKDTGALEEFDTFEKLWDAYSQQLKAFVDRVALYMKLNYSVAGDQAGYLHISLLMNDCIARGNDILNGGVRYENASSEIYGIISAADSFTAIRKLVYEDHVFTLSQLVNMLDCDFNGYEKERQLLLKAPKYGNDNDYADEMACKIFNHIAQMTIEVGKDVGLNRYNIVSVNNSGSAEWGVFCLASACGRHKGAPMSNGNGASISADQNGLTSLLNSMSKIDPTTHVGVIHNIRFTKEMMNHSYDKIKTVLRTFYENGGVQTNIAVIGKEDLENAMKTPEQYQNLIIRVGGFSARFVELDPVIQNEILLRTTYES